MLDDAASRRGAAAVAVDADLTHPSLTVHNRSFENVIASMIILSVAVPTRGRFRRLSARHRHSVAASHRSY